MTRQANNRGLGRQSSALPLALILSFPVAVLSGQAIGQALDGIPIDHAPVFLLAGASPNLVITLDSSGSMSAAHGDANDSASPAYDGRDSSALTNPLYYDPGIVYLPPVDADGRPFDQAEFTAAPRDFFRNIATPNSDVDCTLDLSLHYTPLWDENHPPCAELPDNQIGQTVTGNLYSVDPENPGFTNYYLATVDPEAGWMIGAKGQKIAPAPTLDQARDWARYCLHGVPLPGVDGAAAGSCPAFYYAWDPKLTYGDLDLGCGTLDPHDLSADQSAAALPACLSRVLVGSDDEVEQTESLGQGVHAARAALLATPDEAGLALDTAYKKTLARRNFANWYSYYRNRWRSVQTAVSRVTATLAPSIRVAYQNADDDDLKSLSSRFAPFDADRRQLFQSWSFGIEPPTTDASRLIGAALNVEEFCTSDLAYLQDSALEPGEANPVLACRNNFHLIFSDGVWQDDVSELSGRSPWLGNNDGSRQDLPADRAFARTLSPAPAAYEPTDGATRIFADSNTAGLADAVFHAWVTDLRPEDQGADSRVATLIWDPAIPKGGDESNIFWNPANDPADWQHLTTFAVGTGVRGEVRFPLGSYGDAGATIATDGFPGGWSTLSGAAEPNRKQRADDLWHAGINGRGGYSLANRPDGLIESLQQVMDRVSGAARDSAATSAPILTWGSADDPTPLVIQARLQSVDWTGDVRAYAISTGPGTGPCPDADKARGEICDNSETGYTWSAADHLDGNVAKGIAATPWDERQLVTGTRRSTDGGGVSHEGLAFSSDALSGLSVTDAAALLNSVGDDVDKASAVVDYIAGRRDLESLRRAPDAPYAFRDRKSLLGDIINGGPLSVGAPRRFFNDEAYVSYAGSEAGRAEIVYAGANDGLLHGFDASTGRELFAYVPRPLLGKLAILTDPAYGGAIQHGNFVDGPIAEGDAYFSTAGRWNPVLVGALGLGAQGVYAIRSPTLAADSEVDPSKVHLWDFTDEDDPDMGYVLGKPAIVRVRMSDGSIKWVAVFGNGYNSSEPDGRRAAGCEPDHDNQAATCGRAVLYVVDIESGRLVAKLDTGKGRDADPRHDGVDQEPNGLGQPTVIGRVLADSGGRQIGGGDPIATVAYAGDLFGNLWRFNLRDLDTATVTAPTLVFRARGPDGLAQPITGPIVAAPHPSGVGTLVLFGTGRYLALTDVTDQSVQTFYGIWDLGETGSADTALVARDQLLGQQLEDSVFKRSDGGSAVLSEGRTSSRNALDWSSYQGWLLDLVETGGDRQGERLVQAPQVRGDRVIFVTLVPNANPCKGGGESWINALAYATGSALDETPFDFDRNGVFDSGDLLTVAGSPAPVPGTSFRLTGSGIYTGTSTLPLPGGETQALISTSEGEIIELRESSALRWRVWQQIQ